MGMSTDRKMYGTGLKSLLCLVAVVSPTVSQMPDPATGVVTGALGDAPEMKSNPEGVAFRAILPERQFFPTSAGLVKGIVLASTNPGGTGVTYNIKITNLPEEGGPFIYHIHQAPVAQNGNCNETGPHLDPFERGEMPPCNPDQPQTCQVGDLAGKHGAITSMPFRTTYTDDFTATADSLSFIGHLSVVIHFANLTRITCANLEPMEDENIINFTDSLDDLFNAAYATLDAAA